MTSRLVTFEQAACGMGLLSETVQVKWDSGIKYRLRFLCSLVFAPEGLRTLGHEGDFRLWTRFLKKGMKDEAVFIGIVLLRGRTKVSVPQKEPQEPQRRLQVKHVACACPAGSGTRGHHRISVV